ncbi:MAG TPA: hypothetical protein VNE38_07330 [Ktedonobacteraceae bacterium]|nr:hypothetical protein [Ktedonobacteraceae bacterium]
MSDHTPTVADLCSAIAEGSIVATLDGETYQVNMYELRRYFNRHRSQTGLPTSTPQESLAADDPDNWTATIQTFVA